MSTIDRGRAESWFESAEPARNPERGTARALTGIGYAILDLADAIRESKGNTSAAEELARELLEGATLETTRDAYGMTTKVRARRG